MNLDWFYKKKSKTILFTFWFFIAVLSFVLIYVRYNFVTSRSRFLMERVDKEVVLSGIIVTEPDNFGFKKSLTIEVKKMKVDGQ